MKIVSRIFFIFIFLFLITSLTRAQTQITIINQEQPKVINAVAPQRHVKAAIALKKEGKVHVEVEINAEGQVVSSKINSGQTILNKMSEDAARMWTFEKSSIEKRKALLTFEYKLIRTNATIEDSDYDINKLEQQILFKPPYSVTTIVYQPSVIHRNVRTVVTKTKRSNKKRS